MKSPPVQFTDDEARTKTEEFIAGDDAAGSARAAEAAAQDARSRRSAAKLTA